MDSRTSRAIPIGILVAAFVIRLIFLLQTRNLPFYYHPVLDSSFFEQWAGFKKSLSWLDASTPFREPLYAYFLALLNTALRESFFIARLVQAALGAVSALLVYSIARMAFGRLAAVVSGVIFALYVPSIFFSAELNETTLVVFLLLLSAFLLVRAGQGRPYLNSGSSGLFLGLAFLGRLTAAAALPAWVIYLALSRGRRLKTSAAILIVGFAIAPTCYHFFLTKGQEVAVLPLRSGWHAFLGSAGVGGRALEPVYEIRVGERTAAYRALAAAGRIDGQRDALRFARIDSAEDMSNVAACRYWSKQAVRDFRSQTARYLKNYVAKVGMLFGASEPPANIAMRFISGYSVLLRTRVFTFAVVAPLGLLGLITTGGRKMIWAAVTIPAYALLAAVYLVSDIDKMLMFPFLCLFAGSFIAVVSSGLSKHRGRSLAYVAMAVVLGLVLSRLPSRPYSRAEQLTVLGDIYNEEALFEKAQESFEEAIKTEPDLPGPYISMARLYGNTGKTGQAVEVLDRALARGLSDPRLVIEKASLLIMQDRPGEAIAELQTVAQTYPYEPRLHQMMGVAMLASGMVEDAVGELERELSYVGGGFITYSTLGRAELQLGAYEEAMHYLESALALNPFNTSVAMELADAYSKLDQHLKACDVLARVLKVDPGNMPLRFKLGNCLYRAERYDDALEQFQELHKYDPANADVLLNMGTVYAAMDSLDRAVETWERTLELDPDNDIAKQNLRTAREQRE